ncbi:MAG TPA: hypothetical protein VLL54_12505 [Pyrinomonadaceae bacterium]|nr:hypothetical protein [Pyrinomonadaceae bacterium]
MFRKLLSATLVAGLLVLTSVAPLVGQTYTTAELQKIAKTKARVAKLSNSPNTKVIVQLEGGEEVKGLLSAVGASSFSVEQADARGTLEIPYFQVKEIVKKPSTGQKIGAIGVFAVAGAGVLFGAAYLLSKCGPCME